MSSLPALPSIDALSALTDADLSALRNALVAARYDTATVARAEGIAARQFDRVRLPLVVHHLEQSTEPSSLLARLFAYGATVRSSELVNVFGQKLVDALVAAELLHADERGVSARYLLMPFEEIYVLSDPLAAGPDATMGPGMTTAQLANAMHVAEGERFLDVGTGAGTLALVAARRGAKASGVDISARAIALSRWNSAFNELSVEWGVGDLFEPVSGARFDHIVSQPPFVMSLDEHAATFLHGGEHGDELAMRVITGAASHLTSRGTAIVRVDVPVRQGSPLVERVRACIADAPLDVLVFASPGATPDFQAVGYAQIADPAFGDGYARAVGAYRLRLTKLGVTSTSQALVVLRSDPEPRGKYALMLTPPALARVDADCIADVERAVLAATAPPDAFDWTCLVVPEGTVLVDERPVGSEKARRTARFTRGPANDQELSDSAASLLDRFAAPTVVGVAVDELAERHAVDRAKVRSDVHRAVRDALVRGLLRVAEG